MPRYARRHKADPDSPELTEEYFRRARPVVEVMPEIIEAAKRARGRPKLAAPKAHVSLRLDAEVLAAYKSTGAGWQRRINDTLARAVWTKRTAPLKRAAAVKQGKKHK